MTVERLEREMPSREFTEWDERDRLETEEADERARQDRMEDLARGGLPRGRGHRRTPPVIGG